MSRKPFSWFSILVILLFLGGLACNVGGQPDPTQPPPPPSTATPVPVEPTQPPAQATKAVVEPLGDPLRVNSLQDVKLATVQIEAEGSFVDPQVGLQMNVAGRGSGFIIDESGIAVTNNHVVTGAALFRVWVGGESEPRNARLLGVSECSDLAVIDLEGDGYRYLEWYDSMVLPGLDVYAAGYPLGDPEFTLTRGIVSKERADGESDWASVDYVIEHDATINPGNSGGPLVTADGKVVGVNYASSPSYNQYYAIARGEALPVIDRLRQEQDVTSIGVNGTAVSDGSGLTGIWVSSVASGSPAEKAGVKGGDIITLLEGYALATDGTMADYCDILRSHGPDDTLAIQVLRYDTEEVLEGQLNGNQLEHAFSFAQVLGDEVGGGETGGGAPATYDYMAVTDDTGALTIEVPTAWGDIDGSVWEDEGDVLGASLTAASNIDDFYNTYQTPGVIFVASEAMAELGDEAELLSYWDFSGDCTYEGRYDYEDALYSGSYDLYSGCNGLDTILVVLAAFPEDYSFATMLLVQATSDSDLDAVDHILDTFVVVGDLPGEGIADPGPSGGDDEATLTVINDTGDPIWYIYISPVTSDSWGEDWLGGDVLMAFDSYYFYMPAGVYDLAAADTNGNIVEELYEVELSGDVTWTISGDGSGGSDNGGTDYVSLELINNSGQEVCYVFISESVSDSWGDDWLGASDTIPAGTSYTFVVPYGGTFDLQALDCNNDVLAEEYEVYFDQDKQWTLSQTDSAGSAGLLSLSAADVSWNTWAAGGGEWIIEFTAYPRGGDGTYSYEVGGNTYYGPTFQVRYGCNAAFTGNITVRSGDGQVTRLAEDIWIAVPSNCN